VTARVPHLAGVARVLAQQALREGWRIERTTGGHIRWLAPDARTIIISAGTPSDWRAEHNLRARLRRAGLAV